MNLAKTLTLFGAAALLASCSSLTNSEPPKQQSTPDLDIPLTHVPYPAEAYLTRRVTGDQARCGRWHTATSPVLLAVPVAMPGCEYHGAANAISLLTTYYGPAKAVCEINEDLATAPKPAGLPGCCAYLCDNWRCDNGNRALDLGSLDFQEVLLGYYGLRSRHWSGLPGNRTLQSEIAAGRPVIIKYGNFFPVRWTAVIGILPPPSADWRREGNVTYLLADLSEGQTHQATHGELRRSPRFGLGTETWTGIIPAGRCQ